MKQKINLRLTLIALFAVIATTVGITLVSYNLFKNRVWSDLQMSTDLLCDTGIFQEAYEKAEEESGNLELEKFSNLRAENLRVTWIAADGTVLFDNDLDADALANHGDRPEILMARQKGSGHVVRHSDTFNMDTFYYAQLQQDGTVLRLSTDARSITSVFLAALPIILLLGASISVLCSWIGHMLTWQLLEPLNRMAENLDDNTMTPAYHELIPFADKLRSQHENVLAAVRSRQDFTANVSHELKTPLTAISGYADLIAMSLGTEKEVWEQENETAPQGGPNEMELQGNRNEMELQDESNGEKPQDGSHEENPQNDSVDLDQVRYFNEQIRQNSDRLRSLINDIIRLSELDQSEYPHYFTVVPLHEVVQECCDSLSVNAYAKRVSLKLECEESLTKGDRELLRELVNNLVQNGIQYNNPGGSVEVMVRSEGGHAIFRVRDDGIGIPKDQQERIFERFYRVDKSRSRETGGTGLGLAIVKHIVQIHGAQLELNSEPGQGTEITVRF